MRPTAVDYVPYDELDGRRHVMVDGGRTEGTVLVLSHWPRSGSPSELADDLSAQIVFRYLDRPDLKADADAVSNNHFDQDGLVCVFALTEPAEAQRRRHQLVDVARAGDFGTLSSPDAARVSAVIAAHAAEVEPYSTTLPLLTDMLDHPDRYRRHWEEDDGARRHHEQLLRSGAARIDEVPAVDLAVATVPEGEDVTAHRFTQRRPFLFHPMAINNATDRFRVLVQKGRRYDFTFRYETWVQYRSRRPLPRVDLTPLAEELSAEETGPARWVFDGVDRIAPRLHLEGAEESTFAPEEFRRRLESVLAAAPPAWDPYDP